MSNFRLFRGPDDEWRLTIDGVEQASLIRHDPLDVRAPACVDCGHASDWHGHLEGVTVRPVCFAADCNCGS